MPNPKRGSIDVGETDSAAAINAHKSRVAPVSLHARLLNNHEMRLAAISPHPNHPPNTALHYDVTMASIIGYLSEEAINEGVKYAAARRQWMSGRAVDCPTVKSTKNAKRTNILFGKDQLSQIPVTYNKMPDSDGMGNKSNKLATEEAAAVTFQSLLNYAAPINLKKGPFWSAHITATEDVRPRQDNKGHILYPTKTNTYSYQAFIAITLVHWSPVCDEVTARSILFDIVAAAYHHERENNDAADDPFKQKPPIEWGRLLGNCPGNHKFKPGTFAFRNYGRDKCDKSRIIPDLVKQASRDGHSAPVAYRTTTVSYRKVSGGDTRTLYEYAAEGKCSITGIVLAAMGYAVGRAGMVYGRTEKAKVTLEAGVNMRQRLVGKTPKSCNDESLPGSYYAKVHTHGVFTMPTEEVELPSNVEWWRNCRAQTQHLDQLVRENYCEMVMVKDAGSGEATAVDAVKNNTDLRTNEDRHMGRLLHGRVYDMGIVEDEYGSISGGKAWLTDIRSARPCIYKGAAFSASVMTINDELHICVCACEEVVGKSAVVMVCDEVAKNVERCTNADWPLINTSVPGLHELSCGIM